MRGFNRWIREELPVIRQVPRRLDEHGQSPILTPSPFHDGYLVALSNLLLDDARFKPDGWVHARIVRINSSKLTWHRISV
jgi:hypothetical protein